MHHSLRFQIPRARGGAHHAKPAHEGHMLSRTRREQHRHSCVLLAGHNVHRCAAYSVCASSTALTIEPTHHLHLNRYR